MSNKTSNQTAAFAQRAEEAWLHLLKVKPFRGRILEIIQNDGSTTIYGPIKEVWVQWGVLEFTTQWTRIRTPQKIFENGYLTVLVLMSECPLMDEEGVITFPTVEGHGRIHPKVALPQLRLVQ